MGGRPWLVVGTLFATLFFVFGAGYNTAGVFFTPLLTEFGWSRAQVSLLQTTVALAAGLVVPLVGVLLDRLEARVVIVTGALVSGVGFLFASRATDLSSMLVAYAMIGVGIGASTLLPVPLVIANWFGANRGLALGVAMTGTSTGGMVMTLVADRAIAWGGWRTAYLVLALPIFVVVVPLVVATVRTRPDGGRVADAAREAPGLDVSQALRTPALWCVCGAQFLYAFAASGTNLHAIPHLMGLGYVAARAALVMSLVLGVAGVGKLAMGALADRIGARRALATDFVLCAGGLLCLLVAAERAGIVGFVVVYGLAVGAPLTLVPLVLVDSLGLKRFGSLSGIAGIFNVLGGASGPVVAGRVFDLTQAYGSAFELFASSLVVAGVVALGCAPLAARARTESAGVVSFGAAGGR
jgi:MFS family permease